MIYVERDVEFADLEVGLAGKIPIRSKFALLLYATRLARFHDELSGALDEMPANAAEDFQAFLAQLLIFAVRRRLRRNLSKGYLPRKAVLKRVRGRIDVLRTISTALLEKGEIACRFEEMTADTPRNRLVRSALSKIGARLVDGGLSHACRALSRDLCNLGVSAILPSRGELSRDVIGRNDAQDFLMISVARLLLDPALPWEREGDRRFGAPADDLIFWRVYEQAVARIIELTHPRVDVRMQGLRPWPLEIATVGAESLWPGLAPDIVIARPDGSSLIVDTKFTSIVSEHFGKTLFKSGHLYQMFTYLLTAARSCDNAPLQGLLLYPTIQTNRDEWATVCGHRMRLATVDLSLPPADIVNRIQQLVAAQV